MTQYLRISLKMGAAYDGLLGLFILLLGRRVLGALGGNPDPFLLFLSVLPLFLLAGMYWAAANSTDVDPFRGPVYWARGFGGLYILILVLTFRPTPMGIYILIGLLDWVWLLIHHLLWRR